MLEREDIKWKQRAKLNWYQSGDENTKFFHMCAYRRKRRNQILQVKDTQSVTKIGRKNVQQAFEVHFKEVYCSTIPSNTSIDNVLDSLECKVSREMNESLEWMVMGLFFFQENWHVMRDKVSEVVVDSLNEGLFDEKINITSIVLIAKIDRPTSVSDFRPISLYNVVHKLIAKLLANRLKRVLPEIFFHNQSAFILGRLITNNIMIAYEALHTMTTRQKGKKGSVALELDMSKAYDKIEWPYLRVVMKKIGFGNKWIE